MKCAKQYVPFLLTLTLVAANVSADVGFQVPAAGTEATVQPAQPAQPIAPGFTPITFPENNGGLGPIAPPIQEAPAANTTATTAPATGDALPLPVICPDPTRPEARVTETPVVETPAPRARPTGDCMSRNSHLGDFACVACGIEASSGQSASNWVGLLGIMAKTYYPDAHQRAQVIEMAAAFGYCTDSEYSIPSTQDTINNLRYWLRHGLPANNATDANRNSIAAFQSQYGLYTSHSDKQQLRTSVSLFDFSRDRWNASGEYQRQREFRNRLQAYAQCPKDYPRPRFEGCARGLQSRIGTPPVGVCTDVGLFDRGLFDERQMSNNDVNNYVARYNAMASACGNTLKTPQNISRNCTATGRFNLNIVRCETDSDNDGGGGNPPDPVDPVDPGKGGEPEAER